MTSKTKIRIFIGIAIGITVLLAFMLITFNDQILDAINPQSNRHSGGLRVYRAVRAHVQRHGTSEMMLGDLVRFDWDYVFLFRGASRQTISYVTGINYTGRVGIDTAVILFTKNNAIVYYETHSFTIGRFGDTQPPRLLMAFSLWRIEQIRTDPDYQMFNRYDIFRLGYRDYGDRHRSFYWLHDVGMGSEIIWD